MKPPYLVVVLFFFSSYAYSQNSDDSRWATRFSLPGVAYTEPGSGNYSVVTSMVSTPDYIVVGGDFCFPSRRIALVEKKSMQWIELDGVLNPQGIYDPASIRGLYADGDSVFVWGSFTVAGTIPAPGFAVLHPATKQWTADTMLDGSVASVLRYGKDIIVSGSFRIKGTSIENIALRKSNGSWSAFTQPTPNTYYARLCIFRNDLYAYGYHYNTNLRVKTLHRWDGQQWHNVVDSLPTSHYHPADPGIYSSPQYLYLVCSTKDTMYLSGNRVLSAVVFRFDGTNWEAIADKIGGDYAPSLQSAITDGDDIYVGGNMTSIHNTLATGIAKWNTTQKQWSAIQNGVSLTDELMSVNALMFDNQELFAGGMFAEAGGVFVNNIARFHRQTARWSSIGASSATMGIDGRTALFTDKGQLLAVGDFSHGGNTHLNYIAYWQGARWAMPGNGILGGTTPPKSATSKGVYYLERGIHHIAYLGSTMYLAGAFEYLAQNPCYNIATFDNGVTQCVGNGVKQSHSNSGSAFSTRPYISSMQAIGNSIYIVGDFFNAGGTSVQAFAQWDGTRWNNLNNPLSPQEWLSLNLAQDSAHHLLVAGSFSSIAGKPCSGVARWDGTTWMPVGYDATYTSSNINSMCVASDGTIFIAGRREKVGEKPVWAVWQWDGSSWNNISGTVREDFLGSVRTMACKGELLYVVGDFSRIGGVDAQRVAVWNMRTRKWSALGSGFASTLHPLVSPQGITAPDIRSITFVGDTVYFGGRFSYAGGKPSFNIAAWLPASLNSVEQTETTASVSAITLEPNPASSLLTLKFSVEKELSASLDVYDVFGRKILHIADGKFTVGAYHSTLDLSALAQGVYYCVLQSSNMQLSAPLTLYK